MGLHSNDGVSRVSWGGRPACHPPPRWPGFVAAPFGKGWHTPGGSCPSRGHFVSSRRQKVCGACSLCGVGRRVARALSEPSTQISLDLVIHEVGVFDRICAVSLLCPQGLHQLLPRTCVPPPATPRRGPSATLVLCRETLSVSALLPAGGPLFVPQLSQRPISEIVLLCQTGLLCLGPLC